LKSIIRASGAIAVFVIVYFFSPAQLAIDDKQQGTSDVREQTVVIDVSNDNSLHLPFAVKARFQGEAKIDQTKILLQINNASFYFPERIPSTENQHLKYIRVELVKPRNDSWEPVRQSEKKYIDIDLRLGDEINIEPFELAIPINGINSLTNHWLVFSIAVSSNGSADGFSQVHSRSDIF